MWWWRCILEQGAKESPATSGHQPRPPATGCGECFGNIEIIARIVNIITNTDTAANQTWRGCFTMLSDTFTDGRLAKIFVDKCPYKILIWRCISFYVQKQREWRKH